MSTPLYPLPELDLLKVREVATALGINTRTVVYHCARGNFPAAFQTPGNEWRIPYDAAVAVGREMGVWDTRQDLIDDLPPDSRDHTLTITATP